MTIHHCDRCRCTITGNRSVLQATRGELAVEVLEGTDLAEGLDLCSPCAAGFLDWLCGGNPSHWFHHGPGGALADTAVASDRVVGSVRLKVAQDSRATKARPGSRPDREGVGSAGGWVQARPDRDGASQPAHGGRGREKRVMCRKQPGYAACRRRIRRTG
jgi:hypothetical protein